MPSKSNSNGEISILAIAALISITLGAILTSQLSKNSKLSLSQAQVIPTLTPIPTTEAPNICNDPSWTCTGTNHFNCANEQTRNTFNDTWCCGRDRWLYEDAQSYLGNPTACGGKPSKLKSAGCNPEDVCDAVNTPGTTNSPLENQCSTQCVYSPPPVNRVQKCYVGHCLNKDLPCSFNVNCGYVGACLTGNATEVSCANPTIPQATEKPPQSTVPPTPTIDPAAMRDGSICPRSAFDDISKKESPTLEDEAFLKACTLLCNLPNTQICTGWNPVTQPYDPGKTNCTTIIPNPVLGPIGNSQCRNYSVNASNPCSVTNLLSYFGCDELKAEIASLICLRESGGIPDGDPNTACLNRYYPAPTPGQPQAFKDYSVGLFQFNMLAWFREAFSVYRNPPQTGLPICEIDPAMVQRLQQEVAKYQDPEFSKNKTYEVSKRGTDWHHWRADDRYCNVRPEILEAVRERN